uniref:PH domain-containing protein n=1 Tax=Oryzias latipes TaxID=8090 RepID=A0A3P9KA02_ORYLA
MEGILYKWTNYMTGWQPRWFVLENGVISYYDSEDDVNKGSKGSIKMSVCDIKGQSAEHPVALCWEGPASPLSACFSSSDRFHPAGSDHPWRAALLRACCERR